MMPDRRLESLWLMSDGLAIDSMIVEVRSIGRLNGFDVVIPVVLLSSLMIY